MSNKINSATSKKPPGRVEDRTGFRLPSLIKPCVRFSHTRLSDVLHTEACAGGDPVSRADPLGLLNPAKAAVAVGNAVIAGFSSASGGAKIAIAAGLSPAAVTGVGALPPTALFAWGAWNLISARAAFQRSIKQWREAQCEKWSDATFKNFWGLAPQGDKYDDPSEYGNPYDYIQDKGWWKAISEGGYF